MKGDKQAKTFTKTLLAAAIIAIGSGLTTGCAVNPATGTPDVVLMSESEEVRLGKEVHEELIANTPVYTDEKLQAYIEKVGNRIAANGDRPELKYHFTILDLPDINAFALPGGYVYVNRGLLTYLKSEAQLAAVLSHEIGHITGRHAVRQDAAKKGAGLLSIFTILSTGSWILTDLNNLWSSAAIKGYGREMELEADRIGANYLYRSGYDPEAMIETIGILKDEEKFHRALAKAQGRKGTSYHGLFSTHPRNDVRLRTVVKEAATLPPDYQGVSNEDQYREATEGVVYGVNYQMNVKQTPSDENRYTHDKLGFTLVFPEHWKIENRRSEIVGEPEQKDAKITLEIRLLKRPIAPTDYIRDEMNISLLKRSENFKQYGLVGHTGLVSSEDGLPDKRVAAFFQGRKVYLFTGSVEKPKPGVDYDEMFIRSMKTFRPALPRARLPDAKRIHYVKANENTTFAQLARYTRLGRYSEDLLRLINGYYPRGEPKPGEWIKIVK